MSLPSNFSFLAPRAPLLAELGATAERLFPFDPASCVLKLRLLAEAITQDIAARLGVDLQQPTQAELLRAVDTRLGLEPQVMQLFHLLRRSGNVAAHDAARPCSYREGLDALKVARELAVWFHRSFGPAANFKPGPFQLPDDPSRKLLALQQEVAQLQAQLLGAQATAVEQEQAARLLLEQAAQERAMAERAQEEVALYQALAEEAGQRTAQLQAEFQAQLERARSQARNDELAGFSQRSNQAAQQVQLDEAATRRLIDQQLSDAGWEADTTRLSHANGTRPEHGKNLAIAEWPTAGRQAADYMLFAGLTPLAAVEAKRKNVNVAGKVPQAERYSRGLVLGKELLPAWQLAGRSGPWPDGQGSHFQVPFVFSSNSRPLVKQWLEASGTWFRDVRHASNTAHALMNFKSPQGLLDQLTRSRELAEQRLQAERFAYLGLREYQVRAIQAVEAALFEGRRRCLVAMATGTGKTRTIIGLMYRLLKAERFRRILFLVDRTALGTQAQEAFDDALLEQNQPLSKIYNVAELGDMVAQAETRVQVATVQAMVRRLFGSDKPPPVDEFDCVIVDEAHRGYALDQEMTEGELALRDPAQYLSTYRRVLDYFDAVRIGLTATPARHTSEIFGRPVFTYSYREAVADDWLIDHEPPIRYETLLTRHGIHFPRGQQVETIDLSTSEIETSELEDDLDFHVESFNKQVVNQNFNRVICEALAEELDPFGEEKTLIFCVSDTHADTVRRLLGDAFKAKYGEAYNQAAVQKITGTADRVDLLIRQYKNEALPNIAITVELLTTGIDVPAISHIVFMRRVGSRVLYEQMIGRATRRCDAIGKTVFKIHDPVDIYAALQAVNTMRPLVKDPKVTTEQLLSDLGRPASLEAPGAKPGQSHAHDVLAQLSQKLMRVLRRAAHRAERHPKLQARLQELEQIWGLPAVELPRHLRALGPQAALAYLNGHPRLLLQLAELQELMGLAYRPVLSQHEDELLVREQSWGRYQAPEDYLDSFARFVCEQLNQHAALAVVVKRPKDLTRAQLREVRLLLDEAGYSEASLQAAWRNKSHLEVAASIVGYIRQAALGEALLPFEQRVAQALQRIYAQRAWSPVQRKWLERLARQLAHEVVLDAALVNSAFAQDGGAQQLDKMLGGQLPQVMAELATHLWPQQA